LGLLVFDGNIFDQIEEGRVQATKIRLNGCFALSQIVLSQCEKGQGVLV